MKSWPVFKKYSVFKKYPYLITIVHLTIYSCMIGIIDFVLRMNLNYDFSYADPVVMITLFILSAIWLYRGVHSWSFPIMEIITGLSFTVPIFLELSKGNINTTAIVVDSMISLCLYLSGIYLLFKKYKQSK